MHAVGRDANNGDEHSVQVWHPANDGNEICIGLRQ